jgi:hypothetical protein
VNAAMHDNLHTFLDVQSCLQKLGGLEARYFATIDLRSSFFQLELHPESRKLTRFTVPGRGSFVWQVSPQGLKSSPSAFSRLMEVVMRPVAKSVSYLDDVILAASTKEELLEVINHALHRLAEFNLKVNLDKCIFGAHEVEYLGFRVSSGGIRPSKEKTKAISEYPEPTTPLSLRRFVGIANYFRNHVKDFSKLSCHLTKLIRQDSTWKGGALPEEAYEAFTKLKSILSAAPVVHFIKPTGQLELETDGSIDGLGAVLFQVQGGERRVIAYGSRGLQQHERNYSAYLLEMAAAVFGIENFHVYLWGNKFDLIMDHKPLTTLGAVHKRTLNRLQTLMNEYNFTMRYRPGEENTVADALSRAPVESIATSVIHLRQLQQEDPLCSAILRVLEGGTLPDDLQGTRIQEETRRYLKKIAGWGVIKDGCAYIDLDGSREPLLVTPKKSRYELLRAAHSSRFAGHGGEGKTLRRLRLRYWWPTMAADVAEFVKTCEVCQKSKSPPHMPKADLHPLPVPDQPNIRVHLDLFSVPKESPAGNKYVLVIT